MQSFKISDFKLNNKVNFVAVVVITNNIWRTLMFLLLTWNIDHFSRLPYLPYDIFILQVNLFRCFYTSDFTARKDRYFLRLPWEEMPQQNWLHKNNLCKYSTGFGLAFWRKDHSLDSSCPYRRHTIHNHRVT